MDNDKTLLKHIDEPRKWKDLAYPDELQKLVERLRKRLAEEYVPPQDETAIIRKNGKRVPVGATDARMDWQGQSADLVVAPEITNHKQTEEALGKSEVKYRTLFNNIADPVFIFDQETHRFLDCNQTAIRRYGYTLDELRTMTPVQLHPPDEAEVVEKNIDDKEDSSPHYYTHITKEGERLHVEIHTDEVEYEGRKAWISIVRDITERKRMEEALLESAARLKDEFLAMMSHELRTPLNVVLGMSEVLQEEIYGPLNDRQLKSLRMIKESGHRLLEIITDILDLYAINTGKMTLEITPVAVELVFQASLQLINPLAQKKKLKVSFMLDNAVTTIHADERLLKRVLVSLLSNAVKFTPEGGRIGLEVESDADHQVVRFTVWDTGIGIAEEDMERLFQPFVQLDSRLSRKYEGTGLGLSLVYRLVELLGGSISVESEVGKGSRFTVLLPWKEIKIGHPERS
jgi:PAS domain S-box-containing protein